MTGAMYKEHQCANFQLYSKGFQSFNLVYFLHALHILHTNFDRCMRSSSYVSLFPYILVF